jgi:ClpP class serine protease
MTFATILTTAGVVVVGAVCVGLYKRYNALTDYKKNRNINNNNYIPVITTTRPSIISTKTAGNNAIDSKTFVDFARSYDSVNCEKDITIIIHTHGGMMTSGESIINMILNHNFNSNKAGKIKCFIPYFAYSCGFLIALTCDEIVMYKNAIVGPCDAQMKIGSDSYSIDSIIKTIEYKKQNNQKIDEKWYAAYTDALKCSERQQDLVNNLVKLGHFTEELGGKIHDEFFTGKFNHDKIFTASDLQKLGIKVTIVDEIPDNIKNLIGAES